jgi:carbon starvation protein
VIWPLFGTTNQLLAALSLIVIAVYLRRLGRSIVAIVIPMSFLLVMTIWAMVLGVGEWLFGPAPNYLMGSMGLVILAVAAWTAFEAFVALRETNPSWPDL